MMALAAAGAPPQAAANYGALPMDILYNILLCLPADEVCRLRLVCRSWRSLTSDPHFARAHASRHRAPNIIIVVNHDEEAAEVHALDLHGNVIKWSRIQRPIGPVSVHGDLLCASHGWGLTCVVDIASGAMVDVVTEHRKVNLATPYCVLGHVPSTGEYKVLRIQANYLSTQRRQMCEVMTVGGGGNDGRRWRRRTNPPVTLCIDSGSSSWKVTVAAGLAYFLVGYGFEGDELNVEADSIAVFDLATEEWKPEPLRGPLTSSLLASTDGDDTWPYRRRPPWWYPMEPLTTRFQLARLGDSVVLVYCNVEEYSTELWFLEDMDGDTAPRWSRWYTLQCTPFALDKTWRHNNFRISASVQQYHLPLAVLDDGRILVWVDKTSALRAYDPETCAWTDLATLTGGSVVGLHHGRLLCSNHGAAQP